MELDRKGEGKNKRDLALGASDDVWVGFSLSKFFLLPTRTLIFFPILKK